MLNNKPAIKLYGERNTGTNYLEHLIKRNIHVTILRGGAHRLVQFVSPWLEWPRDLYFYFTARNNLGWKHAVAVSVQQLQAWQATEMLYFVTITKNPYSWLLSMHRRPYHFYRKKKTGTFENFLQTPWRAVGRENYTGEFETPIDLWNLKNRSYLNLNRYAHVYNLRYEDLLASPEITLQRISDWIGISFKQEKFINIQASTKGDHVDFAYYQDYYLNEHWRDKLSPEAIDSINDRLDKQVVEKFEYVILHNSKVKHP